MKRGKNIILLLFLPFLFMFCNQRNSETSMQSEVSITAKDILGNPKYQAICYGGYRQTSRDFQPTVVQLKEDLKILSAMGIKVLRTYNVQFAHASNVLKAIRELKSEDDTFEMYVMLGAWIDCKNAWTEKEPDHDVESENNAGEIQRAVALANQYPGIVKILAVGNEAMVNWATSYYVKPTVILKWVNYLQDLKKEGKLSKDLWITSSDDFASWGGGDESYHVKDLEELIKAVDYVSMHTYPYHNTHYNPEFWGVEKDEENHTNEQKLDSAMNRALQFAKKQYLRVSSYVHGIAPNKPIHIGETGWATVSNGQYGPNGSKATDEYKGALYYNNIRKWTNKEGISCFYFEAFNEQWKDAHNQKGSENHFGLFTVDGKAKYVLWDLVDNGTFIGLKRGDSVISKTYDGNKLDLMKEVDLPPLKQEEVVEN